MLAAERQSRILQAVEQQAVVRAGELARLLGVSPMTIRRDLDRLAAQGKLHKVHGGATLTGLTRLSTDQRDVEATWAQQTAEKESIAMEAAAMVAPGSTIGLSAGTTALALARHLRGLPGLTIVTNSVPVADVLHQPEAAAPNVILTGGQRTSSGALVGPVAVSSLRLLHLDLVFLGVYGLHTRAGLTKRNVAEAATDQALVDAGRCLVVVADHTKWGLRGISTIAPLARVDVLVCDDKLGEEGCATIRQSGAHLVLARSVGALTEAP